jgi:predicted S18 family serine protease
LHQETNKVVFIGNRNEDMSSAALTSATRSALGALVEREARRVGSRSVAYEHVAQMVGASSSWVQKFLRDSGEVKEPRITLFQNIRAAYGQLCERVEKENEIDELRLRVLKGQIDAVTEGIGAKDSAQNQTMDR